MTQSDRIRKALAEGRAQPNMVAARCQVSTATVSMWANGTTKTLKAENVFPLADATGFSARWIATGEGDERVESGQDLPPQVAALTHRLIAAHTEGRLNRPLVKAIEAMIDAAAPHAAESTGHDLLTHDAPSDLDALQAILSGQEQIRSEFTALLSSIRAPAPPEVQEKKSRRG